MVFGGSIGKLFGLGDTRSVITPIATAFTRNPLAGQVIGGLAQGAADRLSEGAKSTASDVSAPPAGIDSPATTFNISQTSSLPMLRDQRDVAMDRPRVNTAGGFGVPGIISQVGRTLTRPGVGGLVGGAGTGFLADFVMDAFGNQKKLVITRKLQRETKKLFMMSGGDLGIVSMNSLAFLGKDLSEEQVLMVLFKTFKNQGPYVTKAAVRKTRQTIRKMETLCDLKDRLAPPKRATRRAPARRSTMITQVK
jgi:hypothetical protein|tara:strand:- start:837 stop:1589 length:753 start_codon:yes stop_codon:yes gene_type:complete